MASLKTGKLSYKQEIPSVILLVDVDCFEVQVWQKFYGMPPGRPCLTASEFGIITSVNHAAKSKGVSRNGMSLGEAKKICRDLEVIQIPTSRFEKPDSRTPRFAGYRIADSVSKFFQSKISRNCVIQQSSKDEFFIDVTEEVAHRLTLNNGTPNMNDLLALPDRTHLLHHNRSIQKPQRKFNYRILNVLTESYRPYHKQELALVHGAIIADRLIKFLKQETDYECSAGIGHNPLTAKLACGLIKPAGIAILPTNAVERTSKFISIKDIPNLGGKKGRSIMNKFRIRSMFELSRIPASNDQDVFSRSLARGEDSTRVRAKAMSQVITCGKSFKGYRTISRNFIYHLDLLCAEMHERLGEERERNNREAISFRVEIKCFTNVKNRKAPIHTLLGESFENTSSIENNGLLEQCLSKIDKFKLTDDIIPKIAQISVSAKFPKLEDDDENV